MNGPGAQTAAGTTGTVPNEQASRSNIDEIGAIVSRLLSQGAPDQQTITVNRQDLQQTQQYLDQLRQSLGQPSIKLSSGERKLTFWPTDLPIGRPSHFQAGRERVGRVGGE